MSKLLNKNYPCVTYKNDKLIQKQCTDCSASFWHISSQINYCGSKQCNQKNKKLQAVHSRKYATKRDFVEDYKNFFTEGLGYTEGASWIPIQKTTVKDSSTNLSFVTAGTCLYERFYTQNSIRRQMYPCHLFLTNQFCYRFEDLKNVSVTKRHSSGFFMLGLHCFESESKKFPLDWRAKTISKIIEYYVDVLGVPLESIFVHADSWSDKIREGPSQQIFVNGIETGNVVYTDSTTEGVPLEFKYVDVGLGFGRLYKLASVSNSDQQYFEDPIKDSLRTVLFALKDKIYPSKLNIGYNIRKRIEFILKNCEISEIETHLKEVLQSLSFLGQITFSEDLVKPIINIFKVEKERCIKGKLL